MLGRRLQLYCTFEEVEPALDLLEELLSIPGFVTIPVLRLDPGFDHLRDNPRFQRIVQEYMP